MLCFIQKRAKHWCIVAAGREGKWCSRNRYYRQPKIDNRSQRSAENEATLSSGNNEIQDENLESKHFLLLSKLYSSSFIVYMNKLVIGVQHKVVLLNFFEVFMKYSWIFYEKRKQKSFFAGFFDESHQIRVTFAHYQNRDFGNRFFIDHASSIYS